MAALSLFTAAHLTRLKLDYGLMSPGKAVGWARGRLRGDEDPPYFIAQMAEMKRPRRAELIDLLERTLRGTDEMPALRGLLGGLYAPLNRNPRLAGKFAAMLAKISEKYGDELPEDLRGVHVFAERLERMSAGQAYPNDWSLRVAADLLEFLGLFRPQA